VRRYIVLNDRWANCHEPESDTLPVIAVTKVVFDGSFLMISFKRCDLPVPAGPVKKQLWKKERAN
jgi:hypothetical protein